MYRGRFIPETGIADTSAESPTLRPKHARQKDLHDRKASLNQAPRRIACILIDDFPVAALVRLNPEWRDRPLSLTRQPTPKRASNRRQTKRDSGPHAQWTPHSELSHVSAAAVAMGVRAGMTTAQARALLPDLIVAYPSAAAEQAAHDALIDVAYSVSPVLEEHSTGCVWLDLTGMQRLHRQELGRDASEVDLEQAIAEEIARRVRQIGLEAAVGIASIKEIAYLAARCGGLRPIAAGREREFLDWMPLELTGLWAASGDLLDRLKRMGIRRLGDLARLDPRAIGSRLGEAGVTLARLGRGEGSSVVVARPQAEVFTEAIELDYGIETLEPLTFIMRAMLDRMCARLRIRGLAAGDLTLSLGLVDRRRDERRIAVAAPTIETQSLLTLIRLNLETQPPAASVETIRVTTEPRGRRPIVNDLFLPPAPAQERLAVAIARIASLCGPDHVGTLLPAESYRPEAVRVGVFAPPPADRKPPIDQPQTGNNQSATPIALRTVRPAEEVEVLCVRETPEFVRGQKICARVISSAGPWRRQGEWWAVDSSDTPSWQANRPSTYARDYYELALADGAVYRIYLDHQSQKWFVDGIYD